MKDQLYSLLKESRKFVGSINECEKAYAGISPIKGENEQTDEGELHKMFRRYMVIIRPFRKFLESIDPIISSSIDDLSNGSFPVKLAEIDICKILQSEKEMGGINNNIHKLMNGQTVIRFVGNYKDMVNYITRNLEQYQRLKKINDDLGFNFSLIRQMKRLRGVNQSNNAEVTKKPELNALHIIILTLMASAVIIFLFGTLGRTVYDYTESFGENNKMLIVIIFLLFSILVFVVIASFIKSVSQYLKRRYF